MRQRKKQIEGLCRFPICERLKYCLYALRKFKLKCQTLQSCVPVSGELQFYVGSRTWQVF